jgi:peptidoglycan/LPS O-acetylase OafA/YrhL
MNQVDKQTGIGGRLAGVDGLRAAAALWVVFFHIHSFSGARFAHVPGLDLFLRSGSTGVSLFLVLSGFCLYVPFAGGRTARFKTGQFFWRRCKRLMPAYYVSLLFAAALAVLGSAWLGYEHFTAPQLGWQVLAHVALLQTLFPATFYSLNGAYWSLGLEWQLYLGLPILILGVRRFGLRTTALAAIACNVIYRLALEVLIQRGVVSPGSVLATVVLPNQLPGRWAEFVFGMVAAELYVTGQIRYWADKLKYALIVLVPLSVLALNWPLSHMLFGAIFFTLLGLVLASNNLVSRFFSWRPLVALGIMSYSLYLVHQPVIQLLAYLMQVHGHLSANMTFLALVLLLPVILLLAYGLFVTVERHTLQHRRIAPSATESVRKPEPLAPTAGAWLGSVWPPLGSGATVTASSGHVDGMNTEPATAPSLGVERA